MTSRRSRPPGTPSCCSTTSSRSTRSLPGIGGGFFNGAQEFAFDKNALEEGLPVSKSNGKPNQKFNVAIENMGLLPTPDGTCASDNTFHLPGIACWFTVIPAQAPDPSQYDNSYGGSGFMLASLDFYGFAGIRMTQQAPTRSPSSTGPA